MRLFFGGRVCLDFANTVDWRTSAAPQELISDYATLLKNLEEPPAGTIFLLISHAPGRLLPTIRSRCRLLRFDPLDDAAMAGVLRDALPECDAAEIAALVKAGQGSPGRALGFAGLELAKLDEAMAAIARDGDPGNARRAKLAKRSASAILSDLVRDAAVQDARDRALDELGSGIDISERQVQRWLRKLGAM